MKCKNFRERWDEFAGASFQDDSLDLLKWAKHKRKCAECRDWALRQNLKSRGVKVKKYPCVHLADRANRECSEHPDPWECPDRLVIEVGRGEFILPIRDGGRSGLAISHCPWCGVPTQA